MGNFPLWLVRYIFSALVAQKTLINLRGRQVPCVHSGVMSSKKYCVASKAESGSCSEDGSVQGRKSTGKLSSARPVCSEIGHHAYESAYKNKTIRFRTKIKLLGARNPIRKKNVSCRQVFPYMMAVVFWIAQFSPCKSHDFMQPGPLGLILIRFTG